MEKSLRLPSWLFRHYRLELVAWVAISFVTLVSMLSRWFMPGNSSVVEGAFYSAILVLQLYVIGLLLRIEQNRKNSLAVELITDASDLYNQFFVEAGRCHTCIRLSHVRRQGFSVDGVLQDFQASLASWVQAKEQHQLMRIVGVYRGDEDGNTAAFQLNELANSVSGYKLRGLRWPLKTPMVNYAIFDDRVAFICLYRGQDEGADRAAIWALRVNAPEAVRNVKAYFDSLWNDEGLMSNKALTERYSADS